MAADEIILIPSVIKTIADRAWSKIETEVRSNTQQEQMEMYFVHGTPTNIIDRALRRAKAPSYKNKVYPLFCLVHNYRETFNSSQWYNEVELNVWLMNIGTDTIEYEKRYTENFVKVLYPLWQSFIKELRKSGSVLIDMAEGIDHVKVDRPAWGLLQDAGNSAHKNAKNIDGIELRLNLKLDYDNCLRLQKQNRIITN